MLRFSLMLQNELVGIYNRLQKNRDCWFCGWFLCHELVLLCHNQRCLCKVLTNQSLWESFERMWKMNVRYESCQASRCKSYRLVMFRSEHTSIMENAQDEYRGRSWTATKVLIPPAFLFMSWVEHSIQCHAVILNLSTGTHVTRHTCFITAIVRTEHYVWSRLFTVRRVCSSLTLHVFTPQNTQCRPVWVLPNWRV